MRTLCAIPWLDDYLLVFDLQRRGGEFAAKQDESQSSGAITSFPIVTAMRPAA
jgi:hypothetical protein